MSTQTNGAASFLANSAISAFRGVVISTNRGVGASFTAAVTILGFTTEDAEASSYVTVKFFNGPGTHKVSVTSCPVTVASILYAGTGGQVSAIGTITVGQSLVAATTNGTIIEIVPIRGA